MSAGRRFALAAVLIALAGCGLPSTSDRSDPIPVRVCGTVEQTPERLPDEVCTALDVPLDWTPVIVPPDTEVSSDTVVVPGTAVRWWIANPACLEVDDHTAVGEPLSDVYRNGDGDITCDGFTGAGGFW